MPSTHNSSFPTFFNLQELFLFPLGSFNENASLYSVIDIYVSWIFFFFFQNETKFEQIIKTCKLLRKQGNMWHHLQFIMCQRCFMSEMQYFIFVIIYILCKYSMVFRSCGLPVVLMWDCKCFKVERPHKLNYVFISIRKVTWIFVSIKKATSIKFCVYLL